MSKKHPVLIGTFILTATGFISRFIGFFFRMFLSHTFGEEQVGLYQLIFPIYALCFSLTCAGIETAISRCVANKISLKKEKESLHILYTGITISVILSLILLLVVQTHASEFSIYILGDIRCEAMLIAISYALPFAAIHSCICGYYFGLKQTEIPASSQLVEQLVRVLSVYFIYQIALNHNGQIHILFAVFGIVIGEFCSALFCILSLSRQTQNLLQNFRFSSFLRLTNELLTLSIPLTSSRVLLNILQSIESISIPIRLQYFGYTNSEALSNYGVLTGMALPCIFFPTAISNSLSTMLLPTVAEIQTQKNYPHLRNLIGKVIFYCVSLGSLCCLCFFILSHWIGNILFHSELAGNYLKTLAWLCPFLYLNSTLISITNGLGKSNITFLINTIGLGIRITGVLIFIPLIGMNGYLWGLLLSQCLTSLLTLSYLFYYLKKIAS